MGPHNKVGFESIYAFGNQDAVALAAMVHLQLQNLQQKSAAGCSLTVTPLHFVSFVNGMSQLLFIIHSPVSGVMCYTMQCQDVPDICASLLMDSRPRLYLVIKLDHLQLWQVYILVLRT